jgi:sporulation killing factor
MKSKSSLVQAAEGQGSSLVRSAGCVACWRFKNRAALRACGKPNPILLAA